MIRAAIRRKSRKPESFVESETPFGDLPLWIQKGAEAISLGPSAVNAQPWRVLVRGDCAHFYEKKSRGGDDWDIQKIDMGIALCHFELGAAESGLRAALKAEDPGISAPEGLCYIASFRIG